ncbi:protein P54-like isoform X6 [Drosophila takahashii]|uniref:protein P54-like isoform X6 n=1 Tax=Drosophila takahashii TaxID=29030 RepID=UPI0038994194
MNNNKIIKLFLIIVSVIGVVEMGVIPTSHLTTYNETMETTIIQILLPNKDVLNIQLKLYLFKNSSLANINNIDELESKLKTSQEEPTMASYITEERKLKKDEDDEAPQATTMASYITEERKLKKDEDDEAPQETTTTTTETTTTEASSSSTEASSSSTEASSSSTEPTQESSSSTPPPANFQIYDEYDDLSSPSKQSFTPLNEEDGNNDNLNMFTF